MRHHARAGTQLLTLLTLLAFAGSLAAVAQEADLLAAPDKAALPLALRLPLKDPLIDKAVRETLAESKQTGTDAGKERGLFVLKPALSGDSYAAFGRRFSDAQKPSCLGPDALKHQPAGLTIGGWHIGLGGMLALPFWGAAIVRGKCN
jgi:hypothetical protein